MALKFWAPFAFSIKFVYTGLNAKELGLPPNSIQNNGGSNAFSIPTSR